MRQAPRQAVRLKTGQRGIQHVQSFERALKVSQALGHLLLNELLGAHGTLNNVVPEWAQATTPRDGRQSKLSSE